MHKTMPHTLCHYVTCEGRGGTNAAAEKDNGTHSSSTTERTGIITERPPEPTGIYYNTFYLHVAMSVHYNLVYIIVFFPVMWISSCSAYWAPATRFPCKCWQWRSLTARATAWEWVWLSNNNKSCAINTSVLYLSQCAYWVIHGAVPGYLPLLDKQQLMPHG